MHALLPGLINLHTHAAMALLRGVADDLPLRAWLEDHIWPAEARHVSDAFVEAGTLVAAAEMLRSGTTCFHDMYFFPEAAARAARRAGIRAILGLVVVEFPTSQAKDAADYIAKAREAHAALATDGLVRCGIAPHAPYTVSDATFTEAVALADEFDVPLHVHVHETEHEIEESLQLHGRRPLERLDRLGAVSSRLVAAHCVHLTPAERDLLAERGAAVAHCPASNLKLASGVARIPELFAAGATVALGTDGAASSNDLDLFSAMRLAALLHKGVGGDATVVPAAQILRAATVGGATALGLADSLGSIEVGKRADLVAVDLDRPHTQPVFDPVSTLVYAAGRADVRHVWVEGVRVVRDGRPTRVDTATVTNALAGLRGAVLHAAG
jgi:5-methylthioadenosine/S-adenosylhomocysteine deaminase